MKFLVLQLSGSLSKTFVGLWVLNSAFKGDLGCMALCLKRAKTKWERDLILNLECRSKLPGVSMSQYRCSQAEDLAQCDLVHKH